MSMLVLIVIFLNNCMEQWSKANLRNKTFKINKGKNLFASVVVCLSYSKKSLHQNLLLTKDISLINFS